VARAASSMASWTAPSARRAFCKPLQFYFKVDVERGTFNPLKYSRGPSVK